MYMYVSELASTARNEVEREPQVPQTLESTEWIHGHAWESGTPPEHPCPPKKASPSWAHRAATGGKNPTHYEAAPPPMPSPRDARAVVTRTRSEPLF